MAFYRIEFKPSVQRDFRPIPKDIVSRIWEKIEALAEEPLPRGVVKISDSENLYRIRMGNYRIIYSIDHEARIVLIQNIRHRREAYRSL
jgi:mRNA interferase RelE/StbE